MQLLVLGKGKEKKYKKYEEHNPKGFLGYQLISLTSLIFNILSLIMVGYYIAGVTYCILKVQSQIGLMMLRRYCNPMLHVNEIWPTKTTVTM